MFRMAAILVWLEAGQGNFKGNSQAPADAFQYARISRTRASFLSWQEK